MILLREAVDRYIEWQKTHGARFVTSGNTLHLFCKYVGEDALDATLSAEADVLAFLAGDGPLTRYRANKYGALAGFYRYAVSRGYTARSPLPAPRR